MCGIWALLGSDYAPTQHEVEFLKIVGRGPDLTVVCKTAPKLWFGFHRLAIVEPNGVDSAQPIVVPADAMFGSELSVVCNGEIYNHLELKAYLPVDSHLLVKNGGSDCAAIVHAFRAFGGDLCATCAALDGVFAFLMTDGEFLYVGRDPLGVRPLFYGVAGEELVFGSEMKCIEKLCDIVHFFPPGCCARIPLEKAPKRLNIQQYFHIPKEIDHNASIINSQPALRETLIGAVKKRLMGERLFGFMLSGGLDSSLVASIATRLLKKRRGVRMPTAFSVGFEDSHDLQNARHVAQFLGIPHRVLVITPQDCIDAIPDVVYAMETFDPLLIRCGVAHFLLCKHIAATSDVKVLLSGEGADELFGSYAYMQRAPSHAHLHREILKRLSVLHQYDVLRCDRATSCHGLEIRVPFLDKKFVELATRLPASYKLMSNKLEKFVLRSAFKGWLPDEVIWRSKEGFSEALGKVDLGEALALHADTLVSDQKFQTRAKHFPLHTPHSKEEFWYRSLFEKRFKIDKVHGSLHIRVYNHAEWQQNQLEVPDFSKEEQEIRFRQRVAEAGQLAGVA